MNEERRNLSSYDIADHPLSNLEWWYCYAFLDGNRGNRYTLAASFFRVGDLPILKGHYMIYSLVRLNDKKVTTRSLLDRTLVGQMLAFYLPAYLLMNPTDRIVWSQYRHLLKGTLPYPHLLMSRGSVQSKPTKLDYGQSQLAFEETPNPHFRLHLIDQTFQAELLFHPLKPLANIDEDGKLNKLRYQSLPRNQVLGQIEQAGMTETVTGEGWFDHQWGRDYGLLQGMGWDWFGLQLDDGRDVLISRLHSPDADSPQAPIAKLIEKNGTVITSENVILKPLKYWSSIYTKIKYPIEWHITLPDFSIELRVIPQINNQEIPIIGPLQAIWEGSCTIIGEQRYSEGHRKPLKGKGFIELVGYAK